MVSYTIALLATFGVSVFASPAAFPEPTPAPSLNDHVLQKRDSCTFSGSNGASSASVSQTECATIVLSAITVPSGTTLDLSNLEDDTTVIFEGETTWEYAEWDGPLLQIKGTRITVEGASGSALDGNGAQYWDGEGGSGGVTKPKFFYAHDLTDSTISNLRIQNAPKNAVSISGVDGLTITDMTIDDSAGDDLGKNTDCFNVGESNNVVIDGAQCYNQDDCVAVNSGTDITFQNGLCSGGHGLSIGSVGGRDNNVVDTVTFKDSEITKSVNGIRIKTIENETGSVTGVTYSGITLSNISRFGIIVEQNYDGGDLDGGTPTSGVPITDLTIENIDGADGVDSDGYNIVIVCGSTGCSDWTWSDVTVTGGEDYSDCEGEPSGISCST